MDYENIMDLKRILPNDDKTILLSNDEIDDPWYTRDFDSCFMEIYISIEKLIDKLK